MAPLAQYPCYSARLLRPFLSVLNERLSAAPDSFEPEQRLQASYVHALLGCARGGDAPALALAASEAMVVGDAGLLDFLMTTAATPAAALEVARSHVRLLSDVHEFALEAHGGRALLRVETRFETPRVVDDFVTACLLRNHVLRWHADARDIVVYFRGGSAEHAFADVSPSFGAEQCGIGFPAWLLDVPLRRRNRRLHAVLRRAADSELARLPARESMTERVLRVLRTQLGEGPFSVASVARALQQHPRSLSRALLREGTTFQLLVARARKDAALHWLSDSKLTLAEVARRSGFHSKAPFHRSFRDWTGDTPSRYRRKQHGLVIAHGR